MAGNSVKAIALVSLDSAALTGGFDVLDAAGLSNSCFSIRITNDSSINIGISLDGLTTHDIVRAADVLELPVQMNARGPGYVANFKKGTKIYVTAPAPGVGFIYLAGYYQ